MIRLNLLKKASSVHSWQNGKDLLAAGFMLVFTLRYLATLNVLSGQGVLFILGLATFMACFGAILRFDLSQEINQDQAVGCMQIFLGAALVLTFLYFLGSL